MSTRAEAKSSRSRKRTKVNDASVVAQRFAHRIAELRDERGETQKQLARRLGMTESMISRFESGQHLPSIATLCRIADGFERRLDIEFHEHEHAHADGTRHVHAHQHEDLDHDYDHDLAQLRSAPRSARKQ